MNPLLTRNFSLGGIARGIGKGFKSMYAGAGSGLFEQTSLGYGSRSRPIIVQDTRRTVDQLTWRKLLSYGRQLHANCGEVRGPVLERAMFAGAGGWIPQCISKSTPKSVRDKYEEWLWDWMKVCDLRGQPYDFWTDMELASIMLDRDGEAPLAFVRNRDGMPRMQWIANHRIYSHWNVAKVTEPGPYQGMWINNGVVFDNNNTPVAYYVLDESLVFSQSITGRYIPRNGMLVMYEPDWCDSGRGVTHYAHGIRTLFDLDDIKLYQLMGVRRDSALEIIRETEEGGIDAGADYIKDAVSAGGSAITVEELQGGLVRDVRAGSGSKVTVPTSSRPHTNVQEFVEQILMGVYQGLPWPYEFTRMSKDAKGANIRVTVEKVNAAILKRFDTLEKIAVRAATDALGWAVHNKLVPPGEFWKIEFPAPPELTADRWRQYVEDRENYKMGHDTLSSILARRGQRLEVMRDKRDTEINDLFKRCVTISKSNPEMELTPIQVLEVYEQRSPNPSIMMAPVTDEADDKETSSTATDDTDAKPKQKHGKGKGK